MVLAMTSGEALLEAIADNKVWAISAFEAPVAAKASCMAFTMSSPEAPEAAMALAIAMASSSTISGLFWATAARYKKEGANQHQTSTPDNLLNEFQLKGTFIKLYMY